MKNRIVFFSLLLALLMSWGFPLFGFISNQITPNYATALGVAYGLFIGIIVHLIVLIVWLAIRRSKLRKAEFIVLLLSFFIMIVLAVISDDGSLSKMASLSHYHGLIGA